MGLAAKPEAGQSGTVSVPPSCAAPEEPHGHRLACDPADHRGAGHPAPVIAPFEENFANISKTLAAPPDSVNIMGTDSAGRDTWSRLLFGAQLTLLSALLCAGVAIAIGSRQA